MKALAIPYMNLLIVHTGEGSVHLNCQDERIVEKDLQFRWNQQSGCSKYVLAWVIQVHVRNHFNFDLCN